MPFFWKLSLASASQCHVCKASEVNTQTPPAPQKQTPADIRFDSWASHDTQGGEQENTAGTTTCRNGFGVFPALEPSERQYA